MFHYVYLLENGSGEHRYVGYTTDLRTRLAEHNKGKNSSTKPYIPWRIIHYEAYLNEKDAKRREKYLKTSQGMRLLQRMIKEYRYEQKTIYSSRISTTRWTG